MPKASTQSKSRRSSVARKTPPPKINGKKRALSTAMSEIDGPASSSAVDIDTADRSPPRKRARGRAASEIPGRGGQAGGRNALAAIVAAAGLNGLGSSGHGAGTANGVNGLKKFPTRPLLASISHPRPSRRLFIFGTGDMGQFGLGTAVLGEIPHPILHTWFEDAVDRGGVLGNEYGAGIETVAAGGMHTLVVDEDGKVWSWGINDNASLGRPTNGVPDPNNPGDDIEPEILETQPIAIPTLAKDGFRAVTVAAGDSISVALGSKGELRAWGSFRSSDGLLGFDEESDGTQLIPRALGTIDKLNKFIHVACGSDHVVALTTTGTVFVWGNGQQAQLGRRIIERRKVQGLNPERLALRRIVCIGSGSYHSFAVNDRGDVYAWGLNSLKQTGVSEEYGGDADIIWTPTIVEALSPARLGGGRKVVQISGGEHHTLFLLSDGSVWACGRCDGFELGLAGDHPAVIAMRKRQREAEEAWVEEQKENGVDEPSDPPVMNEFIPEPVPLLFPPPPSPSNPDPPVPAFTPEALRGPIGSPIRQIAAGTKFNLVVSRQGYVYAFGCGRSCELGLGAETEEQKVPRRVRSENLDEIEDGTRWFVESAYAGGQHCLLLARRVKMGEDIEMEE